MSEDSERELIELVTREQRGFRTILFTGLATLLVVMAMSAGMGFYYYDLSQKLSASARALQLEAFQTRIKLDQQNNRVSAQERRIRRVHEEIRALGGLGAAPAADAEAMPAALSAARDYLLDGRLSFRAERLMEVQAQAAATAPEAALLRGALALAQWERNGDPLTPETQGLPEPLAQAEAAFAAAAEEPSLSGLARAGTAWVRFLEASSPRGSYASGPCQAVLEAVAASGAMAAQPLYWRAQCERKSGRTRDAVRDYADALEQAAGRTEPGDYAAETLLMNAYHGLGTTLIATADIAGEDALIAQATAIAAQRCQPAPQDGQNRMRLAAACLRQAIALRRALRQTSNEVSGSAENLSFAHLREGDFAAALANAQAVKETGLFAWTELVRALAAANLPRSPETHRIAQEARRHIGFFRVEQFNPCELKALMGDRLFEEAAGIIGEAHPGEPIACAAGAATAAL